MIKWESFGMLGGGKVKALALFSGGLDSLLAIKLVLDQGISVEAVHFVTPFSVGDESVVDRFGEELGIKVHRVFLGQEFLDVVADPPHGYGSQMNPCVDCRILMLRKAKEIAEGIGADFLVTGEVLDERPFSQRMDAMLLTERMAGLEGRVLRPLSARLMPETEAERLGLVDRGGFLAIRGRRRTLQLRLAEKFGFRGYLTPSGGCLLTDPGFARRVRDHLKYEGKLTLVDAVLLRVGRHFRVYGVKVIVGRNREENEKLLSLAEKHGIPYLRVEGYKGPVTLCVGRVDDDVLDLASRMTVRYSDAPGGLPVRVICICGGSRKVRVVRAIGDDELAKFRV